MRCGDAGSDAVAAAHDIAVQVDPVGISWDVVMQAVTLWLQYMTLLAGVNIPAPACLHWVFSAANFAFSTITSGALSTDCLLSTRFNPALQRIVIHLAVPPLVLALLVIIQLCW